MTYTSLRLLIRNGCSARQDGNRNTNRADLLVVDFSPSRSSSRGWPSRRQCPRGEGTVWLGLLRKCTVLASDNHI